jgi:hydrogenase expression/formation protein HypC
MSLGVPGQIIQVRGNMATVDFWGVQREVRLDLLGTPVALADYIVVHAGYAIRQIPPEETVDTLAMYEVVLCETGEDPIALELELEPV